MSIPVKESMTKSCKSPVATIQQRRPDFPCVLSVNARVSSDFSVTGVVPVEVIVSSSAGPSAKFNVFVDGIIVPASPFSYDPSGTTAIVILLPVKDKMHQVFVHDIADESCTAIVPLETPDFDQPITDKYTADMRLIMFPNPVPSGQPSFSILNLTPAGNGKSGQVSLYTLNKQLIVTQSIDCDEEIQVNMPHGPTSTSTSTSISISTSTSTLKSGHFRQA
jgi:hypothetical protein